MIVRPNRYAIQRPVEYRVRDISGSILGTGRTLNISRKGLLFEAERELKVGSKIDVMVKMGVEPLHGAEVNLHIQGVTIRTDRRKTAVSIKKYRLKPAQQEESN